MFTVALVGGDGAGKTSVAQELEKNLPFPTKYLYMGLSVHSGNMALPTTRIVRYLKMHSLFGAAGTPGGGPSKANSSHDLHYGEGIRRSRLWKTVRMLNRLAEAWYRQILSTGYQLRGTVVVYDRHFLFETAPEVVGSQIMRQTRLERLEHWLMTHLFPRPGLIVFLDAPPELLYQRKRESSPESLERRRGAVLELGKTIPNFVQVDAAQPLDQVVAAVTQSVVDYHASRNHHGS